MIIEKELATIMDDNKRKALQAALSQIEKQFGKGSIMRLASRRLARHQVVSTGSLGLDIALGVGGLPRGAWSRSTARNRRARPRSRCP
jgi:RecA/RadA recombinase